MFIGEEYVITGYESEAETNEEYARLTLNRPLVDSLIQFDSTYTIRAASAIRSSNSLGTLTVRISLTRVTSHDLLDIGTGSYADTNYPNEIYGPSVNVINPNNEVRERELGRVFYVTTDQFGNFSVGPFFRVDQGTGTVTFSSSIALSNLDGIGFKRGVPVSEFSTDSSFSDNATDTVPTENAARIYIERRLGLTHQGAPVGAGLLIPSITGGFMALDGQLAMKATMDLGGNNISNLADPVAGQDAVTKSWTKLSNLQDGTLTSVANGNLLMLTGTAGNFVNVANNTATITNTSTGNGGGSDITISRSGNTATFKLRGGLGNNNPITDFHINNNAAIVQSKLVLSSGSARAAAPTGTAAQIQAASGLSTYDYLRFRVTNGWVTVHDTRTATFTASITGTTLNVASMGGANVGTIVIGSLITGTNVLANTRVTALGSGSGGVGTYTVSVNHPTPTGSQSMSAVVEGVGVNNLTQIATRTVLGNSTNATSNVSEVPFSTIVDQGSGIKKSQYSGTGFLRRTSSSSNLNDADYAIIEATSSYSTGYSASDANRLIQRDGNGNFAANIATLSQIEIDGKLAIDTTATVTGGFVQLYGWNSAGGVLIGNGSAAADRRTSYWNDLHVFKTQNGVNDAPITASSIQVQAITTGGNTTAGTITGRWTLTGSSPNESRLQATYSADLAEYYEGDKEYEVGTVLVFGGEKEVTTTTIEGDNRVAGVVSNTAAFAMFEGCPGLKNLIALQGRVPCRVVGKIRKGEMLVTSRIAGVAVAAGDNVKVGTVVGKALVDYDSDHVGTIEIAVGRT